MAGFSKEQKQELDTIIEGHIEKLALQVGTGFNEVGERLTRLEDRMGQVEARLGGVELQFDRLEHKFDLMKQRMDKAEGIFIYHRLKAPQEA